MVFLVSVETMAQSFDHEKLRVYQAALDFVAWLDGLLERVPKNLAVRKHLDEASGSIVLNIAEGNGKFTERDRCRYFDISRGSSLECAAGLDILLARKIVTSEEIRHGKELLLLIVSMLVGLIKSNSSNRVHEEGEEYRPQAAERPS